MIETGVDETSWLIEVIASLGRQLFFSLLYLLDIILPSNNRKIYIIKKVQEPMLCASDLKIR